MTLLSPPPDASAGAEILQGWRPRSDADLLTAQLRGLADWHRHMASLPGAIPDQSREARLDEARRRDVAEREREALYAWAEAALRDEHPLGRGAVPRAVVAHRNEWLRGRVCATLHGRGIEVVASTDDGAKAAAAIVIEQPDLVFVEDLLPSLSGLDLIQRTRRFAPDALVGAHALGQAGVTPLLAAGARTAFTRRIPPAEIGNELADCLHGLQQVHAGTP